MERKNVVGWFEIYVSDIERAKNFYETVFQKKLERIGPENPNFQMWAFPNDRQASGSSGSICWFNGMKPANNSVVIYFSCDDCAVEEERAKASGAKIHKTKESIGQFGFVSLVIDPDGNMIGLHSMR